jgi:hypothetical protein
MVAIAVRVDVNMASVESGFAIVIDGMKAIDVIAAYLLRMKAITVAPHARIPQALT